MHRPASRQAARRAWAASILIHAALFGVIYALWQPDSAQPVPVAADPFQLILDTAPGTDSEPPLQLALAKVIGPAELPESVPEPPIPPEPNSDSQTQAAPEPPVPPESPETPAPPVIRTHHPIPSAVPERIRTLVRELADRPAPAEPVLDVVDVTQVTAIVSVEQVVANPPVVERTPATNAVPRSMQTHTVAPASGTVPSRSGAPIHGALPPGSSIVYVLDCSGTMGLDGKLDRARAAILATLVGQPESITANVVVYQGHARILDREQLSARLRELEPAGSSQHAEGVRAALKLKPDYLVLFTDAQDEELATVRPVLRSARHPVSLSIARVERTRLQVPVLFR